MISAKFQRIIKGKLNKITLNLQIDGKIIKKQIIIKMMETLIKFLRHKETKWMIIKILIQNFKNAHNNMK